MPDGAEASILIVLDAVQDPDPLEDFVGVYYALLKAGARLQIASEHGGYPWLRRPRVGQGAQSALVQRFLSDRRARDEVADTLRLGDIFVEDFAACILIGGKGALPGMDDDPAGALVGGFLKAGKLVVAVSGKISFMPRDSAGGLALLSNGGTGPPDAIRALLAVLRNDDEGRSSQ